VANSESDEKIATTIESIECAGMATSLSRIYQKIYLMKVQLVNCNSNQLMMSRYLNIF